ncbi:MAG: type II toxin-antitoxin system prevent-host-death family antitoxin [Verrucomicrobiota bacterium]|nr:type II toxin-antitoxin system prevent-host-death family antitoxin [Verrucomicrobiota bacterium]
MKTKIIKYPAVKTEPLVLREMAVMSEVGEVISVRSAKAHLSALLELVAGGREITITSDGKPKAKLVSARPSKARKVFQGMGSFLLKQRIDRGQSAAEIIRAERDSRP